MNIYYQVKQKINIVKFWVEIAKMSIIPGIMTVGGYFALQNFDLNSWISLAAGIGVYLIVYLPLFFAFSMNGYERNLVLNPVRKLIRK